MRNPGGLIISFEGLDCSFKETNCNEFVNRLKSEFKDSDLIIHKESFPRYGNWSAKGVEKWLDGSLDREILKDHPKIVNSLYSIDRFSYWYEKNTYGERMINSIDDRNVFIFDRYNTSNAIYNPIYSHPSFEDFVFDRDIFNIPNPDIIVWMRMKNFGMLVDIISKKKNKDKNELNIEYLHDVWTNSEYAITVNFFERSGSELVVVDCINDNGLLKSKQELADEVYEQVSSKISMIKERAFNE